MDGKGNKPPMPKVAWAALNLFLREEGYEIRKIGEPGHRKSARKTRTYFRSIIRRYFRFSPKQEKLLNALAAKGSLDSLDIKVATDTKAPRALVRDTRKRIKSHEHLKDFLDVGSYRKGRQWRYFLKVLPKKK